MSLRSTTDYYDYRGNVIVTPPALEPVTAVELIAYLRETETGLPTSEADDFIQEARQMIEDLTGLALITQTWRMTIDQWPTGREQWWDGVREGHPDALRANGARMSLRLPRYPLQSVSSVKTFDEDSNETPIVVADTFDIDTDQNRGRLTLQRGAVWPTAMRANNAIEIEYIAGYGSTADDVPAPLKRAIKQLAAYLYSHRGDDCEMGDVMTKSGAQSILNTYRVRAV